MNNQTHRAAIAAPFSAEAREQFQHVLTAVVNDTMGNLATYNVVTGLWAISPSVVSGAEVNLSDPGNLPAAGLLAIAAAADGVHVFAPNVTEIAGSVSEITALRANNLISTPSGATTVLLDTIAHLGTPRPEYGDYWDINPLVIQGVHVTVTDSGEIPAGFLVNLLSAGGEVVNFNVPFATGIKGTVPSLVYVYNTAGQSSILAGLPVTVTDQVVDAYFLLSIGSHPDVTVHFDHVAELTGSVANVLAVLSNPAVYEIADLETVRFDGLSVSDLAAAIPQIAQYSDAVVKAAIIDSLANLVGQNIVTGVWSFKPGVEAGTYFYIAENGGYTAAAGAVQVLIDAVGAQAVSTGNLGKLTGGLAEINHLLDSGAYIPHFGVALSDATVSAADLLTLAGRAEYNVEATSGTQLSGSLSELSSVFNDTTIVLSGSENISITTALTVAELAAQRTSLALKTTGVITGALADSIANLTTHLAEAGDNGYTVVDTVLNVLAGGAIVDGAHGVTIIAGGPTTMSAADALALVAQVGDGALLDLTSVTSFSGSAVQIKEMLDAGVKTGQFGVTLSDTTVSAATLLQLGEAASSNVAAPAATSVSGTYDDVLSVFQDGRYVLSGTQAISVTTGLTLEELAALKTLADTSGVVGGLLRDSVAHLTGHTADGGGIGYIVRDSIDNLLAGGAVITGARGCELDGNSVPNVLAAADVLALVDVIGTGTRLPLGNVQAFIGSVSEMLRLYDANISTYYFGVALSDATITAGDLLQIAQRAVYSVGVSEGSRVSGTLSDFHQVMNDNITWSDAAVYVTSPVTLAALQELRSHLNEYNIVTGALRDSVVNLTGHLAEAGGNGYTVVDTVAQLLAGGAIVTGARGLQLADSIANLTGHTTAGGATSYSVVDTVANLENNNGVIISHALAVTLLDTVAHLAGHTGAGGATSYIVGDSLAHIVDADATALVNAAAGVALSDTTLDAALLHNAWDEGTLDYGQQIDASGVLIVSGEDRVVSDVLSNSGMYFSGAEQVTLSGQTAAYWANVIDAMTTGAVTASISSTVQDLLTLTGTGNHYDLTVTEAVSVFQLKSLDAIATGTVSYDTVVDTAGSLVKLVGGAWVVDSQLHANTDIIVIGEIDGGALQALQAFDVGGTVTQASPAVNHFNIATSAVEDYIIATGEVTNLIDVAGDQTYHVARSDGLASGGVLNLSGVDGHNTIVFDGYYAAGGEGLLPRAYLTMTQSGTTAYFLDAQTHMQVAAISLNENAGTQYIEYADGSQVELQLVGTVDPVIHLYYD
jgi:hypothetical protein